MKFFSLQILLKLEWKLQWFDWSNFHFDKNQKIFNFSFFKNSCRIFFLHEKEKNICLDEIFSHLILFFFVFSIQQF